MKRLINELRSCDRQDILIIGDIMLDEYIFGSTHRISPEAPVPVLKVDHSDRSLGGAANVAANCQHIGFNVQLIGLVGHHDREGKTIIDTLEEFNISVAGIIKSPHRVTTCKQRIMSKSHQMLRIDSENSVPLSDWEFAEIVRRIDQFIKPNGIILISDYAKGLVTPEIISYLVAQAKKFNCLVMVDPKGPQFDKYKYVDYVKPNLKEFGQMVEFFGLPKDDSMIANGRRLCALLSLQGIIITLGENGILFVSPTQYIESSSVRREVYDITGAGDTVFAFLALGFANNRTIVESLKLANAAAAVAVSHLKTYSVSLDELHDSLKESSEKVYTDWASLKIELDWLHAQGKRVVLTNGCFDIIHPGHIHTLTQAKNFGEVLVVALNTDASVKKLKGPSRPLHSLEDRMTVMAALGVVDFVVPFEQETPKELLEYLRPDVLVKGGDYKVQEVVGYNFITSYGGSVEIIDFVQDKSTTKTIAKMNEKTI